MLSARDYVETMTINRLLKNKGEVDNEEFYKLCGLLAPVMESLSQVSRIEGFDEADLRGFFEMSIHQALRRRITFDRPQAYFAVVFDNLLKNLHRDMQRARKLSEGLYQWSNFSDRRVNHYLARLGVVDNDGNRK